MHVLATGPPHGSAPPRSIVTSGNDKWYDAVAIFSGSTTIVDGKPVIIYPGEKANRQTAAVRTRRLITVMTSLGRSCSGNSTSGISLASHPCPDLGCPSSSN